MSRLYILCLVVFVGACGGDKRQVCEQARGHAIATLDARLDQLPGRASFTGLERELENTKRALERDFVPACMELDDSGIDCMRRFDELRAAVDASEAAPDACAGTDEVDACLTAENAKIDAAMGECKAVLDALQAELQMM